MRWDFIIIFALVFVWLWSTERFLRFPTFASEMAARPPPIRDNAVVTQHDPYTWCPVHARTATRGHQPREETTQPQQQRSGALQSGNAATAEGLPPPHAAGVHTLALNGGSSLQEVSTLQELSHGNLQLVDGAEDEQQERVVEQGVPRPPQNHRQFLPATAAISIVIPPRTHPEAFVSRLDVRLIFDHWNGDIYCIRACQWMRRMSRALFSGSGEWHGGKRVAGLFNVTAELSKRSRHYAAHRASQQWAQRNAWMAIGSPAPQRHVDSLAEAVRDWTRANWIHSLHRPLEVARTYEPDVTGTQRITLCQLPWNEGVWAFHGFGSHERRTHALHRLIQDLFIAAGLLPPPLEAMTILPP